MKNFDDERMRAPRPAARQGQSVKKLLLTLFIMVAAWYVNAQSAGEISGVVTDSDGNPLLGVTVIVDGTAIGTTTNIEGSYTLRATPEQVLKASFIGYRSVEEPVGARTRIDFVLEEDAMDIGDVVVVGYGVQRKSDVTGAVASLTGEMLEQRPQTNIQGSLQGAIPGLNVNITGSNAEMSSSSINIRGSNSISASNSPLIILDGIPFDGAWSEINSADVASLEILKDASSAAIYGARGANGVILITTKKGQTGKLSVSYNSSFTFSKPTNIPRLMNGDEFWYYKTQALEAANTTTPTEDNPYPWLGSMSDTEMRMHENGEWTNWIDETTRTAFTHEHNISLRGGTEKTKFYISANYTDAEGVSLNNSFERASLRVNLDQELKPWLKYSTNTQIGRYNRSGNSPDFGRAFLMNPLSEPYNEDGSVKLKAWEHSSEAFNRNPLSALNERNSDVRYRVTTNNALEFIAPWVKGLSYKLNTGFSYSNSTYRNYQGRDTYYGEASNGIINTSDWTSTDWVIENIVNYSNEFGRHRIFFTALYSAQSYVYDEAWA